MRLLPANADAARIYLICRDQLIWAGLGEAVALNHLAVHAAMRLYKVRRRRECFEKVLFLAGIFLEVSGSGRDEEEALDDPMRLMGFGD